jgi:hypothetical protein
VAAGEGRAAGAVAPVVPVVPVVPIGVCPCAVPSRSVKLRAVVMIVFIRNILYWA